MVEYLRQKIDLDSYLRILHCPKPRALIDLMGLALHKYIMQSGNSVVCGVGFLKSQQRSLIAEISDYVLGHGEIENCIVIGLIVDGVGTNKMLSASFRHTGDIVNANEFSKRIFGNIGSGGRKGAGGALIKLGDTTSMVIDSLVGDQKKLDDFFSSIFIAYANKILAEIKI